MGKQSGQLCIITRCNYTLFNEAVNVCCANNNTKVGFVGVSRILLLICLYSATSSLCLALIDLSRFSPTNNNVKSRPGWTKEYGKCLKMSNFALELLFERTEVERGKGLFEKCGFSCGDLFS